MINLGGLGKSALWGAGAGAAAVGGYNALSDKNASIGSGMLAGAALFAGRRAFTNPNALKTAGKAATEGAEKAGKTYSKFSNSKAGGFFNSFTRDMGAMGAQLGRKIPGFSKLGANTSHFGAGAAGAGMGAVPGALLGAGYGAFSDKESMLSGAVKGALAGAAGFGAFRGLNSKYKFVDLSKLKPTGGITNPGSKGAPKVSHPRPANSPKSSIRGIYTSPGKSTGPGSMRVSNNMLNVPRGPMSVSSTARMKKRFGGRNSDPGLFRKYDAKTAARKEKVIRDGIKNTMNTRYRGAMDLAEELNPTKTRRPSILSRASGRMQNYFNKYTL